jgi:hypothetical protein
MRIAAAVAGVALIATAPGLVASAAAHNGPGGGGPKNQSQEQQQTLTPTQITGVNAARSAYLTSVSKAKRAYLDAMAPIRQGIEAEVADEQLAVAIAADAYETARRYGGDVAGAKTTLQNAQAAYKAARDAAKSAAQSKIDAADAAFKTALTDARSAYDTAIAAVFAGSTVPRGLQSPPGGKGWMHGGMGAMGKR